MAQDSNVDQESLSSVVESPSAASEIPVANDMLAVAQTAWLSKNDTLFACGDCGRTRHRYSRRLDSFAA